MRRGLARGPVRPPARLRPASPRTPRHDRRHRPGARSPVHRLLAPTRPPFSNELVRKAFCARGRPRGRSSGRPAPGALRARRARGGAIPPAMPAHSHRVGARVRPGAGARSSSRGRLPGRQGPTRDHDRRPALAPADRRRSPSSGSRSARVSRSRRGRAHVDCDVLADAHMWWSGWTADYPDPDGFFRGLLTLGWPFYSDDEILELLERAARSATRASACASTTRSTTSGWASTRGSSRSPTRARSSCGVLGRGPGASPLSRAHLDTVVVRERSVVPRDGESAFR